MKRVFLSLFLVLAAVMHANEPLDYAFSSDNDAVYISLKLPPGLAFSDTYMTAVREEGPFFKVTADVADGQCLIHENGYSLLDIQLTVEIKNNNEPNSLDFLITVKSAYEGENDEGELEILRETTFIDGTTTSQEHRLTVDGKIRPEFEIVDDAPHIGELILFKY